MVSTIGIVSLSSGIIGEDFVKHEVDLGIQRLKDLGLNPIFLPHYNNCFTQNKAF